MPATFVTAPHPSLLGTDELKRRCDSRTQSRSGPGGQHRNRTASGVFLTYRDPDDTAIQIVAEATEGRHQAANLAVATRRLRQSLAIDLRTGSPIDDVCDPREQSLRDRVGGGPMRFAESNVDRAAVLALLLNDLHAAGGQPSIVSPRWGTSTSRVIGLIKSVPAAWGWLGRVREHHGRLPLR